MHTCFKNIAHWIVFALASLALVSGVQAQDAATPGGSFPARGVWRVEVPGGQDFYAIVREANEVDFLYAGSEDMSLYPGSWQATESALELSWPGELSATVERGEIGYVARLRPRGAAAISAEVKRVPQSEVGSWTVPPEQLGERGGILAEL
ncbi:MAG: hypothetical protein ACOCVG_05065, partial [Verrucomicrobiota bacterium]